MKPSIYYTRNKHSNRLISLLTIYSFFIIISSNAYPQTELSSIQNVYIEETNQEKYVDSKEGIPLPTIFPISKKEITDGDVIVFNIHGFTKYLYEHKISLKNITLKIEQIELPEFNAYIENGDTDIVRFTFLTQYLSSSNRIALYKLPGKATKLVRLGIKLDETNVVHYNVQSRLYFQEIKKWGNFAWVAIIVFFLFFILLIYKFKSIIKESVINLTDDKTVKTYFSFSRSQFAFWTFIILTSFIYIWIFTGDLNSINTTALILLGITSATIITSNLITTDEENKAISTQSKMDLLNTKVKGDNEQSNFLQDILSDSNGISIHRLQAFVFNLVFGIAFFKSVLFNYALPEFSNTQLILLGISNGTYAFLKISEVNQTTKSKSEVNTNGEIKNLEVNKASDINKSEMVTNNNGK